MAASEVLEGDAAEVGQEIVPAPVQTDTALFRTDDPLEVIEKATAVANALKSVVEQQGLITMISGKEHPRVEAWQTLGAMLGVFPVKEWVREIPWPDPVPEALKHAHKRGLVFGYEASFRAQRPDGSVLGAGEAVCKRTESKWAKAEDHACASMAQTRATSKALAAPLRFVMTLAGYEGTPAEEVEAGEAGRAQRQPAARGKVSGRAPQRTEKTATAKQRGLINGKAGEKSLPPSMLAEIIRSAAGAPEPEDGGFPSEADAKAWVDRQLDRLPGRLVTPILEAIAEVEA